MSLVPHHGSKQLVPTTQTDDPSTTYLIFTLKRNKCCVTWCEHTSSRQQVLSVDVYTAVWILHPTPVQTAALWLVTSFCPCVFGGSGDCQQWGEGKKTGKKETDRWVGGGTDLEQTGGELLQLLAKLVSDFRQSLTLLILQQQLLTHMHTHRKQQQKCQMNTKNDKKTINEEIKWMKCWRIYGRRLEPLVKIIPHSIISLVS